MSDVVVTVPQNLWVPWIEEGCLPGEAWDGQHEYHFWLGRNGLPDIVPGDRVYIVACGKVRGYAPLIRTESPCALNPAKTCLLRHGDAVAVTIPDTVRGFQRFRYRWWNRQEETPFPDWRIP